MAEKRRISNIEQGISNDEGWVETEEGRRRTEEREQNLLDFRWPGW